MYYNNLVSITNDFIGINGVRRKEVFSRMMELIENNSNIAELNPNSASTFVPNGAGAVAAEPSLQD